MATKKKTKKKSVKSKAARRKAKPAKKSASAKRTPKKSAKAKSQKTAKPASKIRTAKNKSAPRKRVRKENQNVDMAYTGTKRAQTVSGRQAGDLQGFSRSEGADSESVDELLEEGNPFEAGVVRGVEEADAADEREVHTHEVPEDDVPDEYLDKEY